MSFSNTTYHFLFSPGINFHKIKKKHIRFSQVSTIKNKNQFPLISIDVTAIQMKEEEERSKIEKGKEGATMDLMQVLLASTKEVKEQNDGFVDVVKKTKGNNGNLFSKEATGGKNSFRVRGIKGISRKMKVQGFLLETASRGKKGIIRKLEILGLLLEFAIKGIMGIIRKIWNLVLIEVGRQEVKMGRGIMGIFSQ